jgi:hypothetical protein
LATPKERGLAEGVGEAKGKEGVSGRAMVEGMAEVLGAVGGVWGAVE